jgi:hypothetical protein
VTGRDAEQYTAECDGSVPLTWSLMFPVSLMVTLSWSLSHGHSHFSFYVTLQSISTWRYYMKQLHTLMTEPDSSRTAYLISLLVLASIIISTITFVLDTVPSLDGPLADRVRVGLKKYRMKGGVRPGTCQLCSPRLAQCFECLLAGDAVSAKAHKQHKSRPRALPTWHGLCLCVS